MSGRRRITVDEPQWGAWERQGRQLTELKINTPELLADLQRQTQSELARVSQRLEDRQQLVERTMSALSDQTRAQEASANRRLRDQANEMCRSLMDTAGKLREETDAALERQQQAWRAELSAEMELQRAELARLHVQMSPRAGASEAAAVWLHDAGLLHDLIRDELPHERYAPGQLAALDRRLAIAGANAQQGQSHAALAVAQETYHCLSELRVDIELRDRAWTAMRVIAYEALLQLDGLAAKNALRVIASGEAGNKDPFDLDVDYWSEGALGELRSTVTHLLTRVNDTEAPLGAAELRDVAKVQVPELERRLSDIVLHAYMQVLASQLRVNVAEIVAGTLDEVAGYGVEDHLYEHLDSRRTFLAKLQHPSGNEIVVSVAPSTDEPGQCVLWLLSYDHDTVSQRELDQRAWVVIQELRSHGLFADDQGSEPGEPDRAMLDFDNIRGAVPEATPSPARAAG
jgi:hypothetical protein